jgi:hypothetical protein
MTGRRWLVCVILLGDGSRYILERPTSQGWRGALKREFPGCRLLHWEERV